MFYIQHLWRYMLQKYRQESTHTHSQVISTFPSTIFHHFMGICKAWYWHRSWRKRWFTTTMGNSIGSSPVTQLKCFVMRSSSHGWIMMGSNLFKVRSDYVILCVTMWAWLSMWSYDSYAVHHSLTCQGPVSCRAYAGQSEKQLAMLAAVGFWGLWTNMPPGWEGAANVSQLCSWLGTSGGPTVSARTVGLW